MYLSRVNSAPAEQVSQMVGCSHRRCSALGLSHLWAVAALMWSLEGLSHSLTPPLAGRWGAFSWVGASSHLLAAPLHSPLSLYCSAFTAVGCVIRHYLQFGGHHFLGMVRASLCQGCVSDPCFAQGVCTPSLFSPLEWKAPRGQLLHGFPDGCIFEYTFPCTRQVPQKIWEWVNE